MKTCSAGREKLASNRGAEIVGFLGGRGTGRLPPGSAIEQMPARAGITIDVLYLFSSLWHAANASAAPVAAQGDLRMRMPLELAAVEIWEATKGRMEGVNG